MIQSHQYLPKYSSTRWRTLTDGVSGMTAAIAADVISDSLFDTVETNFPE